MFEEKAEGTNFFQYSRFFALQLEPQMWKNISSSYIIIDKLFERKVINDRFITHMPSYRKVTARRVKPY